MVPMMKNGYTQMVVSTETFAAGESPWGVNAHLRISEGWRD